MMVAGEGEIAEGSEGDFYTEHVRADSVSLNEETSRPRSRNDDEVNHLGGISGLDLDSKLDVFRKQ